MRIDDDKKSWNGKKVIFLNEGDDFMKLKLLPQKLHYWWQNFNVEETNM